MDDDTIFDLDAIDITDDKKWEVIRARRARQAEESSKKARVKKAANNIFYAVMDKLEGLVITLMLASITGAGVYILHLINN